MATKPKQAPPKEIRAASMHSAKQLVGIKIGLPNTAKGLKTVING